MGIEERHSSSSVVVLVPGRSGVSPVLRVKVQGRPFSSALSVSSNRLLIFINI